VIGLAARASAVGDLSAACKLVPEGAVVLRLSAFSLRPMRHGTLFVLLAAVAGLTGCGGGGLSQTRKAQALFASNCNACHSLIGNESRHRQGGDLVGYLLTRSQLLEFTREMPTRRPLTSSELNTLVDYVLELEQHRRAH
jgi:mono/diheme cytochrome c family protein